MNIAIISYHTCPLSDEDVTQTGGLNIYVLELSKALAKKGYILDIYTRLVDKDSPRIVNVAANLRVIHLPAGELKATKKDLVQYIPQFSENYFKFIKEHNLSYDFVYCHYYMSGLVGLGIKKRLKIPLIINFHTLALMKNLVARTEDERESLERIRAEKRLCTKADQVIATSKQDAKYLSALYGYPLEKIFVLTPGVDLGLFKPMTKSQAKGIIKADKKSKIILFVGRIEPLKGIDVLLYALKILVGKKPLNLSLIIVGGKTKEMDRLQNIENILEIGPYVRFVGRKKQKLLPYYYNASEIVVMPSQYESFGIAALEAMACGTPVVTTDATGISGFFDDSHRHLITSASNPIMLAKKIKHLLENKKDYKRLSKEVFEKAQKLSWEKVAEKFLALEAKTC